MLLQADPGPPLSAMEIIFSAGPETFVVLGLTAVLSLASWFIIGLKWWQFRRVSEQSRRFFTDLERMSGLRDAYRSAMKLPPSPYNRLFREGISFYSELHPAIKGGAWQAGSYTIAGNSASATATVSGLPLAPKGVIIAGAMKTEESAVTGTVEARKSIGTATGISSRRALGWLSENATASSNVEVDHTAEFDSVLAFPSTGGALQSAYDIDAWNADGFRIIVDTAGGVASEWQRYLAFGDGPPKHFLVMAPPAPAPIAEQR